MHEDFRFAQPQENLAAPRKTDCLSSLEITARIALPVAQEESCLLVITIGIYIDIQYNQANSRLLTGACDWPARCPRIKSAARSAIMMMGELQLPDVMKGITDPSTTRKP